ncbi:hypothetical protein HNY73_020935 [Argiope bruennichi]|uniref:Uncharacterized protein n=1 Tax=Argiope bruennichi TaxID=94029 RepID=A0A8T0E9T3_ARGBR|nr:hypothetical protein HNY73_020935 [Argiope bruennichi]
MGVGEHVLRSMRKTTAMGSRGIARITVVIAVLSWLQISYAQKAVKKEALDSGTVQMLSNILESLDAFRNDRLKDLEKIRIATPPGNGTKVTRIGDITETPTNSSVSEHIKALKEGIMGHNPVKKTFGYKVTVYTSPIGEDGKDSNPVLVTQYVGGDMKPDSASRRADETDDLQESANHPDRQLVHSSESAHLPVKLSISSVGGGDGEESSSTGGATDHNRKTEHSASSEKGHQNQHILHSNVAKGHDHERHSAKHDEHHKETEKESHRHDTQAHDKGGATQQGIRERTEIEYYEREHFLDTEYDKAKKGHENTKGLKEHESHNDHDSHEDKKIHAKDDSHSHSHKTDTGGSLGKAVAAGEAAVIDAHHDKGHATHTSGQKLKDQEGAAHGSKEGERDRGFTKEEKKEEAHDAAYDAKNQHYYDGEAHSEGFSTEKKAASSSGEKQQKEEAIVPLAPPVVNYVEEDPHPGSLYPLPIVYSPSNDGAQAVVAYPPENLTPIHKPHNDPEESEYQSNVRQSHREHKSAKQQPLGGYDDEPEERPSVGYVGHATYKRRNPNPLVASIRENVRKDVHAEPPSYSKSESASSSSSENSVPSSENSVRFPDDSEDNRKDDEHDEIIFPQEEEKVIPDYAKYPKEPPRGHSAERVYYPKKTQNQPILQKNHRPITEKDLVYLEEPKRVRPQQNQNLNHNVHARLPDTRKNLGQTDSMSLYVQGAQNADKLVRSAYPQIQGNGNPISELIHEVITGYTQPQELQRYSQPSPSRNNNDNIELAYADLHHLYNLNPGSHDQRQHRTQHLRAPEQHARDQKILSAQKQKTGRYIPHQQSSLEQLQQNHAQRPVVLLQQSQQPQQPQIPRTISALEQLQQQTKPPFSPVVLLSRGPPAQKQNQAVDIWYTRQKK